MSSQIASLKRHLVETELFIAENSIKKQKTETDDDTTVTSDVVDVHLQDQAVAAKGIGNQDPVIVTSISDEGSVGPQSFRDNQKMETAGDGDTRGQVENLEKVPSRPTEYHKKNAANKKRGAMSPNNTNGKRATPLYYIIDIKKDQERLIEEGSIVILCHYSNWHDNEVPWCMIEAAKKENPELYKEEKYETCEKYDYSRRANYLVSTHHHAGIYLCINCILGIAIKDRIYYNPVNEETFQNIGDIDNFSNRLALETCIPGIKLIRESYQNNMEGREESEKDSSSPKQTPAIEDPTQNEGSNPEQNQQIVITSVWSDFKLKMPVFYILDMEGEQREMLVTKGRAQMCDNLQLHKDKLLKWDEIEGARVKNPELYKDEKYQTAENFYFSRQAKYRVATDRKIGVFCEDCILGKAVQNWFFFNPVNDKIFEDPDDIKHFSNDLALELVSKDQSKTIRESYKIALENFREDEIYLVCALTDSENHVKLEHSKNIFPVCRFHYQHFKKPLFWSEFEENPDLYLDTTEPKNNERFSSRESFRKSLAPEHIAIITQLSDVGSTYANDVTYVCTDCLIGMGCKNVYFVHPEKAIKTNDSRGLHQYEGADTLRRKNVLISNKSDLKNWDNETSLESSPYEHREHFKNILSSLLSSKKKVLTKKYD